ncbi:MAG: C25 family cysteine peptidase [Bacteroidales bacterium]
MKKIILCIVALISITAYAGESIEIVERDANSITVKVRVEDFSLKAIKDPDLLGYIPQVKDGARHLEQGNPDLPHLTISLIRQAQNVQVTVVDQKVKTIPNVKIMPSKGNLYRDQDPSSIPYQEGNIYTQDAYFPSQITSLKADYQFRDFRGLPFHVTPMQYNPVSQTLKLYTEITIKISFTGSAAKQPKSVSQAYMPVYESHFLNYQASRYTPLQEEGEMLVFTHQNFDQDIRPFVEWKNSIGIPTKQIRIDTLGGGSAQAIKNYILSYYQQHNLAFVLLVGDAPYVPTNSTSSGDSDNFYGYLSGNDSYPEVMVGRFSAETSAHVNTMVQRTIMYEMGLPNNGSWMNTSMGIASEQGPGDDNEMDYEHIRNMHTDLQGYTYDGFYEMFDGSQGGLDAGGNPTANMVKQAVDQGVGNILYTGHGSTTAWATSMFSNSYVDQLTNTSAWPFIWAVACVNGDFASNTCFAESWTRAEHNGEPTGAVAALMSTINQSWDPPMHAQDEMIDILTGSYANNIKRTYGGISINGCLKMNDAYGSQGDEITDTWALFGDPSFMIRTDTSATISVAPMPAVFTGDTTITVSASVNGARVALSYKNELLDVAHIANGSATLSFPAFTSPDTMDIAVVAYNYDVHMEQVPVIQASGPFLRFKRVSVNDSLYSDDQIADQGETVFLDLMIENVGLDTAKGVNAVISTADTAVILLVDSAYYGRINASDSALVATQYQIEVKKGVTNQHVVDFDIELTDANGDIFNSSFGLPLGAPEPKSLLFKILDDSLGNNDGRLNAGETARIQIDVANVGTSYFDAWTTLISSSTYIDVLTPFESIQNLLGSQTTKLYYGVVVDSTIPDGTTVRFDLDVDAGNYSMLSSYYETIGNIHEDFESKDFTGFSWIPVGTNGWKIDSTESYAGDASAVSGLDYGQHSAVSSLIISLTTLKDDTISFYRRVSSEADYDFLQFYIDNQLQDEWSGYQSWQREAYYVPAGSHTFKWSYAKDAYVSSGADKAWIDDISFPAISTPAAVEENLNIIGVTAYPNPVQQTQYLEISLKRADKVTVELLDMSGRKLKTLDQADFSAGTHRLKYDVSSLASGFYLLRLIVGQEQHQLKLIKE